MDEERIENSVPVIVVKNRGKEQMEAPSLMAGPKWYTLMRREEGGLFSVSKAVKAVVCGRRRRLSVS